MFPCDRQQKILDYIRQHHTASVTELSKLLFVSETSIRRDLHKLDRSGLVHKIYGGAVLVQGDNEVISLDARQQIQREAKVTIARKASLIIENGSVVFLDSSSTALSMVPFLSHLTSLSIITNGLSIASALAEYPHFKVYMLGGLLNARTFSIRGALTCRMLDGMHANHLFVSPKGVDMKGNVYCADEEEAYVRRMMMDLAESTTLLCNCKKLGQHASFRMCSINEVHTIVCDEEPDSRWKAILDKSGVNIL